MDSICFKVSRITLAIMIREVPPKDTFALKNPLKKNGITATTVSYTHLFSQIGFTEDLTFMMNPPFFAPSAPCRGIFCCKLLECVFFLWVRKKSTRKSSFYSIAFCSRKCKKFFTYFFIFFCSFSVHFFISPTGKKKNRRDRFLFSVPPVFYR